jgi:hypothetical protein
MNDFEKSENAFDRPTDDRDEEKEFKRICDLYDRVAEFTRLEAGSPGRNKVESVGGKPTNMKRA